MFDWFGQHIDREFGIMFYAVFTVCTRLSEGRKGFFGIFFVLQRVSVRPYTTGDEFTGVPAGIITSRNGA